MKIFKGKVISRKMQKTAVIAVERLVTHPVYKKKIRRVKKYPVHDEIGVEVGQTVKFVGSKPYSKTKKWKVIEIVGNELNRKPASADFADSEKIARKKSAKSVKKSVKKSV